MGLGELELGGLSLEVIEYHPDPLLVIDPDGAVRVANRQAARLFGRDLEHLVGATVEELLPGNLAEAHRQHRRRFAHMPEVRPMAHGGALRALHASGDVFAVEAMISPIPSRDGWCIVSLRELIEPMRPVRRGSQETMHDPLTGLHNRTYFAAEKSRLIHRHPGPVSVVVLDVDGLGAINAEHGAGHGDQLLRRLGAILRRAFRVEDIVARVGGDEFAVMLPGLGHEARDAALERFLADVERQNDLLSRQAPISITLGAATAPAGRALPTALRQARMMLYQSKTSRGYPGAVTQI